MTCSRLSVRLLCFAFFYVVLLLFFVAAAASGTVVCVIRRCHANRCSIYSYPPAALEDGEDQVPTMLWK